jgi:hypothetical protein
MSEEREKHIKEAVELIYSLENDADVARDQGDDAKAWRCTMEASEIQGNLEADGVIFQVYEDAQDVCHVLDSNGDWLIFNSAEWEWSKGETIQ